MGRLVVGGALLVAAVVYVALRLEVTTDITHFLPAGSDRRLAAISRAVADSELTRTMVLVVDGGSAERSIDGARSLAARLSESERVAWVRSGPGPGLEEAVREVYLPRRFALMSSSPEEELSDRLSDEGLAATARELKRRLALPSSGLVRAVAPSDPLLAFDRVVERLKRARSGALIPRQGQLVTVDGSRAVLFVGSRAPAFDSGAQALLLGDIERAVAQVGRSQGSTLSLSMSGAGRFAVASERAIKKDIVRISVLSTVGIVVLFLLFLRSPRYLLLLALPLLAGVATAAALGLAVFGKLHGLTLAFGATLIGVCIDYAVHLFNHHSSAPDPAGPDGTLRRIWPALLLGALTTVAGLSGLAWTSLPGIREIALFAATGVLASLAATRLLLPPLLPRKPKGGALQRRSAALLGRVVDAMETRRRLLAVVPVAALVVAGLALPRLAWNDDVSALSELDADLLAEEEQVRSIVSQMDTGRFVVAVGGDDEAALRRNDEVARRLTAAAAAAELEGFRSIHSFLPSAELQRRNLAAFRRSPRLVERVLAALEAEGFRPEAFEPFAAAVAGPAPQPLRYDHLSSGPMADLVRPFRIRVGDEVAFLTFLRGVERPEALRRRLDGLEDVYYLDQLQFLSETYRHSRRRTIELIAVGLIAVFMMVLLRYRRLGPAAAAFAPALLAAVTTLSVFALAGVETNLLHLIGLLLVLSMGVDYGVFMVESRSRPAELEATTVSLVIASLSTVLAFGLLGLSSNPALRAMGLTTGLGVLLSLLFAPVALVLLGRKGKAR